MDSPGVAKESGQPYEPLLLCIDCQIFGTVSDRSSGMLDSD